MATLGTLDTYKQMLLIQKHRLDDELELQPEISWRISECRSRASARMAGLKESLSEIEAKVREEAREEHPKATIPELEGIVLRDRERKAASIAYQNAKLEFDQWDGLYEAWKARGFSLKSLADLYIASYFTIDGAGDPNATRIQRSRGDKDYQHNRQAIAESKRGAVSDQEQAPRRRSIITD